MAVTDADVVAVRVFPVLRRLLDLRENGAWFFQPVFSDDRLRIVAGARVWPGGWSDAIAIRTETDAKAFRCDLVGGASGPARTERPSAGHRAWPSTVGAITNSPAHRSRPVA